MSRDCDSGDSLLNGIFLAAKPVCLGSGSTGVAEREFAFSFVKIHCDSGVVLVQGMKNTAGVLLSFWSNRNTCCNWSERCSILHYKASKLSWAIPSLMIITCLVFFYLGILYQKLNAVFICVQNQTGAIGMLGALLTSH